MRQKWHNNFRDCISPDVLNTFGLSRSEKSDELMEWIAHRESFPEAMLPYFDRLRHDMGSYQFSWNEHELLAGFIAPILSLVGLRGTYHNLFMKRK